MKGNVLWDQLLRFNGFYAQRDCPHIPRRLWFGMQKMSARSFWLTTRLKFSANTISAFYRDRRQIELFFKILKQNL